MFLFPFFVWLGFLTFASLVTTASLGIAVHFYHKPVFRYHKFFAFLTITLATIHMVLGMLFYFLGIVI